MKRFLLVAICCLHLGSAAPIPFVRAAIASPRPIIVGQAVRVNVSVFVPNYFMGQPDFPQFNIDDAIVVLPGETPQNGNETIAGESYAGITVSYLIYSQRPGSFKLPDVEIAVRCAANPPKFADAQLRLPPLTFDAIIPLQAADLSYFLPTTSLTITQKLDKPLKGLKVGDTLTRTITISGSKLRAMLIPPTKFATSDGITAYQKQGAVDDIKTDRGEFAKGRRVDSVTYLIRKAGNYTLPEIRLEWWDLSSHKLRTASVPAIHFEALANPNYGPDIAPETEQTVAPASIMRRSPKRYLRLAELVIGMLAAFVMLFLVGRRFFPRIWNGWKEAREARQNSEATHFRRLQRACQTRSPENAYLLLLGWLRRFRPGSSLCQFLGSVGEPELISEIDALSASLFRNPATGQWSGQRMISMLERVRVRERTSGASSKMLPPLNPGMN